jgi:hypothetical protein
VGEGTETLIWNAGIFANFIGVQAKDSSTAVLYNVELKGNSKTIDAYKKNWQYGNGGRALVYKSRIEGGGGAGGGGGSAAEGTTVTADKNSEVAVYDSFFTGVADVKKNRVRIDQTVDSDPSFARKARSGSLAGGGVELPEFVKPHIGRVNPGVRGRLWK